MTITFYVDGEKITYANVHLAHIEHPSGPKLHVEQGTGGKLLLTMASPEHTTASVNGEQIAIGRNRQY